MSFGTIWTYFRSSVNAGCLGALLALVCGCSLKPVGPLPPGVGEHKYAWLQLMASDSMGCPREELTYERFGDGRHMFKGCGQQQEMVWEQTWAVQAAANRFAKEAKCDIKATTEERIEDRTHIVEGCGQRITYVLVCNQRCFWLANVVAGK